MEKKHISDFSVNELLVFEEFAERFSTIEGLTYNLFVLRMDKALEEKSSTVQVLEFDEIQKRFHNCNLSALEIAILKILGIESLEELINVDLDELMENEIMLCVPKKDEMKMHLEIIIKDYKETYLKKQIEKVDNNGKTK